MSRGNIGTKLRTPETWDRYCNKPRREGCFICEYSIPICRYDHWYIIKNDYPYDAVATDHDMLVPFEHVDDECLLTDDAKYELRDIVDELNAVEYYDCILRNFTTAQSQAAHLHYHLIKWIRTGQ